MKENEKDVQDKEIIRVGDKVKIIDNSDLAGTIGTVTAVNIPTPIGYACIIAIDDEHARLRFAGDFKKVNEV